MQVKQITRCALLASVAILFGWVERMLPPLSAVPGVKFGLGNIVVLMALFLKSGHPYIESFMIMLVKISVTGLLFSGMTGFLYSLCGGLLSWGTMAILKKTNKYSVWGISVAGSAMHVSGQMLCAMLFIGSYSLLWYWAMLLFFSVPSGLVIAGLSVGVLKKVINN